MAHAPQRQATGVGRRRRPARRDRGLHMRIGVIGAGQIGGGIARLLAPAGHEPMLAGSRNPLRLEQLASAIGTAAMTGSIAEAGAFGEAVVLSVPWAAIRDVRADVPWR